jgi:hypothetical protein
MEQSTPMKRLGCKNKRGKSMKRLSIFIAIFALLAATLACSLPGTSTPETPMVTEEVTDTEVVTEAPTEAITEIVTEPPYACAAGMVQGIAFTVEFCYPSAYATGFNQSMIAEVAPDPNMAPWDYNPTTIEIGLVGYPVPNEYHTPTVHIYPVADYIALEPNIQVTINDLQTLLTNQDPNPSSVPFLPIYNAAQMMQAKVSYFEFRNGTGVRFITQYGQAAMPINNVSAIYAFMGLTSDGQYVISATFPVTHPDFVADNMTEPAEGWAVFSENYETYINDMEAYLAGQPDNTFTPDLTQLDEIMSSFLVPVNAIP